MSGDRRGRHARTPSCRRPCGAAARSILGTTITPGRHGLPHAGQLPDGTNVGLDVDLRNAVAKVLGVKWDVQNGTFPTIIPGVQNGKYDVGMDNFGVTGPARRSSTSPPTSPTARPSSAPRAATSNQVADITDLCGQTLATSPGSTFQQILETDEAKCAAAGKKPYTVQYFADSAPIWLGLANGKIDVYFGPTLSLKYDADPRAEHQVPEPVQLHPGRLRDRQGLADRHGPAATPSTS